MVLALFTIGVGALVAFGRRHRGMLVEHRFGQGYAVLLAGCYGGVKIYTALSAPRLVDTVPLQLSDLAAVAVVCALWSRREWAFALSYYWCLSLSTQALVSPVFTGPDFPDRQFLAFWGLHVLVIWAAIYLTWGVGLRPTWHGYRVAVVVTLSWVAVTMTFNSAANTNYGYLNRTPDTGSILDLLGPWPWYLAPEIALIALVWALMTWPWNRRPQRGHLGTQSRPIDGGTHAPG
jgi:hypothetical integral membrane protein (TIGR02206 family)